MANNILPAFRKTLLIFPEPKQERDNFSLVSDVLSMDIEEQREVFLR